MTKEEGVVSLATATLMRRNSNAEHLVTAELFATLYRDPMFGDLPNSSRMHTNRTSWSSSMKDADGCCIDCLAIFRFRNSVSVSLVAYVAETYSRCVQ